MCVFFSWGNKCSNFFFDGKINLYLDGINEISGISSKAIQQKILNEIVKLSKDYPDSRLIISDRIQTEINETYFEFPSFLINQLSDNKVQDFIKRFAKSNHEINVLENF